MTQPLVLSRSAVVRARARSITAILCLAAGSLLGAAQTTAKPAAHKTAGPMHISAGVAAGNLLTRPAPVYPLIAKAALIQGTVVLRAVIAKDGSIRDLKVVSGPPLLLKATLDAVGNWTYKPYLLNGEPVEVDTTVLVNFQIPGLKPAVQQASTAASASPAPTPSQADAAAPADWSSMPLVALRRKALAGNAAAEMELAHRYEAGRDLPKSATQAVLWLTKAARQGEVDAQVKLGDLYSESKDIPHDNKKAFYWYMEAAKLGSFSGCKNVGAAYLQGFGVQKDYAQAALWLRKAAGAGDPDSRTALAMLYLQGQGVPQDNEQGFYWFSLAAQQGNAAGLYGAGMCYRTGRGVAQDNKQAEILLAAAVKKGSADAATELSKIQAEDQAQREQQAQQVAAQNARIAEENAQAQAAYDEQVREHQQKVADMRQQADEAEQEAEQAEQLAQQAKDEAQQATNTGGIAGLIGALSGTAVQTGAEIDAQKKRQVADNLNEQLRDMGEQAPDPPQLRNSLEESAAAATAQDSSDAIQNALQQDLNTIQQIADHNAQIQAEQAQQSQTSGQTRQSGNSAYDKCEEANYAKMMAAPSDPHAASKATNNDPCASLQK